MKIKTIIPVLALILLGATGFAQSLQKGSVAKLNYNAGKSGNLDGAVRYNSSFFITGYQGTNPALASTALRLKADIVNIAKLELTEMDDQKTLMVVMDMNASNGKELSEQFRKLFTELGVETISYNESPVNTADFKF